MEKPYFFPKQTDLRNWFKENHKTEKELWVGYYKKDSGIESVDWSQSVDEALCYGWIDGIRKSIDEKSYKIRFTPRRVNSHWSAVNLKKVAALKQLGLMTKPGLDVYNQRDKQKSNQASYEEPDVKLSAKLEEQIKTSKKAYTFFNALAPSYKKSTIHWLMSAKREETKKNRLEVLIQSCEQGKKIPLLRRKNEK